MFFYNTFFHISHKHPRPQRSVVLYDEGYEGETLQVQIANAKNIA